MTRSGEHNNPGLYEGVYTYQEAARLLNVTVSRVSRWADGYVYPLRYGTRSSRPILQAREHKPRVLSFNELMELFFVREFLAFGVSVPHIRNTAEALANVVGEFPFTKRKVLVNGRELLVRYTDEILQRPDIGQLVAGFAEEFCKQVEIADDVISRYYPQGFERQILLAKGLRGGEPVVSSSGIPTRIIYALWEQEKDVDTVAEYYDVTSAEVSSALRYEGEWRLAA